MTDGRTALHIAAAYDHVDIASALLRKSEANAMALQLRGERPGLFAGAGSGFKIAVGVEDALPKYSAPDVIDINAAEFETGMTVCALSCIVHDVNSSVVVKSCDAETRLVLYLLHEEPAHGLGHTHSMHLNLSLLHTTSCLQCPVVMVTNLSVLIFSEWPVRISLPRGCKALTIGHGLWPSGNGAASRASRSQS
jgi:ankyrin repeat protein